MNSIGSLRVYFREYGINVESTLEASDLLPENIIEALELLQIHRTSIPEALYVKISNRKVALSKGGKECLVPSIVFQPISGFRDDGTIVIEWNTTYFSGILPKGSEGIPPLAQPTIVPEVDALTFNLYSFSNMRSENPWVESTEYEEKLSLDRVFTDKGQRYFESILQIFGGPSEDPLILSRYIAAKHGHPRTGTNFTFVSYEPDVDLNSNSDMIIPFDVRALYCEFGDWLGEKPLL